MNAPHRSALVELGAPIIGHTVTPFVRVVAGALAASAGFFAFGPLFRAHTRAYANPVFDKVFAFASPTAWGLLFAAAAMLLAVAAISGRAAMYLAGIAVDSAVLATWCALIIWQAIASEEAVLTAGAIGLYVGNFTAIIGLAASPHQLEYRRPLELVIDDDTAPVPLRRHAETG